MDEWEVVPRVAVATAMKAQEQGVAKLTKTAEQLFTDATHMCGVQGQMLIHSAQHRRILMAHQMATVSGSIPFCSAFVAHE